MFKFISGIIIGVVIAYLAESYYPSETTYSKELDPAHVSNFVWPNLVEVPDDRSGANTWFQQEYDALEWSWQLMVSKYDHLELPNDMAADVITFNYLPWVQELRDATADRDSEPDKKLKLKILDIRIESLKALEKYYQDYKEADHSEYIKWDTSYRNLVRDNPQIFE